MNKKGLHWEQLATGILIVLVVIIVIGIIYYFLVGDSSLFGFLKGTKEKVVTPLEDIDFSQLTASERDKAIEDAVERDAESALKSAEIFKAQGDYENAKRVLAMISSDVEGRDKLLEDVEKKIKIEEEIFEKIRVNYRNGLCEEVLTSKGGFDDEFKILLKNYYTAKCYYKEEKNDLGKLIVDSMRRRYPNSEITKRAVKEFTNQKT